ncbi:hypothetical protein OY671_011527, partial [Metschnikowia pulcherrima]
MNVQPFECVVVKDSVPGVQAARSAGMRALAYAGEPYANRDVSRQAATRPGTGMTGSWSMGTAKAERVIVVGAGMAGSVAARSSHDSDFAVTVLEARKRIGGRTWTDDSLGAPLDLGGSWIHGV